MVRLLNVRRWLAAALAGALTLLLAAPQAEAQEAVPDEQRDEPVVEKEVEEEEEDDDELLEPSPTGYIDDAVIRSKLRLRYDSATGASKADRAEFFYGKCLCFTALFGQDAASPGPVKDLNFQELEFTYEHAFSNRFSLFVEVPFRSIDLTIPGATDPPSPDELFDSSGLSDVRAGMKYGLVAEKDRYVTFQLRGYFASGDAEKTLGTDHASIEPGLLYFSRLSDRLTISSELRWWHPLSGSSDPVSGGPGGDEVRQEGGAGRDGIFGTDDDIQPRDPAVRNDGFAGDILRFGFGASFAGWGSKIAISPVAEIVGWYVVDGWSFSAEGLEEADNDTIVNLKLGARLTGSGPGSFYMGYGFALSHEDWYDSIVRFEYRLPVAARERHRRKKAARQEVTAEDEFAAAAPAAPQSEVTEAEELASGPEREMAGPPESPQSGQPRELVTPPAKPAAAAEPDTAAGIAAPAAAPDVPAAPPEEEAAAVTTREDEALAAVRRWSEAWSAQRVEDYLDSYASGFRPAGGMSRSAWEAQRRDRLSAPSFIRVALDEVTVTAQGPVQMTVDFTQRYESSTFRDTVKKRLVMALEGNAWKILQEETSP